MLANKTYPESQILTEFPVEMIGRDLDPKKLPIDLMQKLGNDVGLLGHSPNMSIDISDHPMIVKERFFEDNPGVAETLCLRTPEYIAYTAKMVLGVDLPAYQSMIQYNLWTHNFPMLIASRGGAKSTTLGFFSVLRCLLNPGHKVVLAGSSFRQSKQIFSYAEELWGKSPMLRSMCKQRGKEAISRDVDRWTMRINDSTITAIPIGPTGDKVRGLRAHDVICVKGDTLLETDHGLMTAKELYDSQDLAIRLWDGVDFQQNKRLIKLNKKAISIETKFGYSLTGGETHRVMTDKGWKQLNELSLKDLVLVENDCDFLGSKITKDEANLLGYFISEGSDNKHTVGFCNTDLGVVEDYCKTLENLGIPYKKYEVEEREDPRGWTSKKLYEVRFNKTKYPRWLDFFPERNKSWEKYAPKDLMDSSRDTLRSFLSCLFEGGGSEVVYEDRSKKKTRKRLRCSYYTASETLAKQVHHLLLKLGIYSSLSTRFEVDGINKRTQYCVVMNGINAMKFHNEIGMRVNPKNISGVNTNFKPQKKYLPVKKIKTVGETELFDVTIPKTGRYWSNGFISHNCDEFAAHNPQIVEEVLFGFGAVKADPIRSIKAAGRRKLLKSWGAEINESDDSLGPIAQNKSIICGTADYHFNHFYDYWRRYKKIIYSRGDKEALKEIFGGDEIPEAFDWRQFCVMRIPYTMLPDGLMSDEVIARAKSSMSKSLYQKEFEAIFVEDSDGFFRRSIIERSTATEKNVTGDDWVKYCDQPFQPRMTGNQNKSYVMGIDPAKKDDNLAIVIIEVHPEHQRIVYCWTTNEDKHRKRWEKGLAEESDYYDYVSRKILNLTKSFNISKIGIDTQGGGEPIMERLRSENILQEGELPIYEEIDQDKKKPSDRLPGRHILVPISFAKYEWYIQSNYGLRGDLEGRHTLFPEYDCLSSEMAIAHDRKLEAKYRAKFSESNPEQEFVLVDTMEDCLDNIEELKDELTEIIAETLPGGRVRFRVPESIVDRKKVTSKKDRYSALLIANSLGRIARTQLTSEFNYGVVGGLARNIRGKRLSKNNLYNHSWYKLP